jgi:hypothetical protein
MIVGGAFFLPWLNFSCPCFVAVVPARGACFCPQSWDAQERYLSVYFLLVIMFLSMFAAQFVLAVLSNSFADVKREVENEATIPTTDTLQLTHGPFHIY